MTNATLLPIHIANQTEKLQNDTVNVCGSSKWANPFLMKVRITNMAMLSTLALTRFEWHAWAEVGGFTPKTKKDVLELYARYVVGNPDLNLEELRGKNLACTCATGKLCHRDVLLKLANK
jgi:hypothetical protein